MNIDDPPNDYYIFGICRGTMPAHSYWQWQGELYIDGGNEIWGRAEAENALYAHLAVRAWVASYRFES